VPVLGHSEITFCRKNDITDLSLTPSFKTTIFFFGSIRVYLENILFAVFLYLFLVQGNGFFGALEIIQMDRPKES